MTHHPTDDLLAFLDGALADPARQTIADHLTRCATCRDELAALRRADRALRAVVPLAPPPDLADRITAHALRRRVTWRGRGVVAALWAASLALAAVGGYAAGARPNTVREAAPADSSGFGRYLILFLERPGMWPPAPGTTRLGYGAWFQSIAGQHRYVSGIMLGGDRGYYVTASGAVDGADADAPQLWMSGFIVVRAADYDDALAMARRSPHLRYGTILVRRIG